ncbi:MULTISPECIES: DapH/DapD/GlmU-related protein [unclassified Bacillus (in: firmicutes)]|uniref:acyltransferase n=1 Tax=unclassified Bacillus (in: firmicutes) TaxID=185979 RepID=UPI00203523A8|nr:MULTISPECIES: acyltransferase [unclassified Bacillus (in: firmicutes)]
MVLKKIFTVLVSECRKRGIYLTFIMYLSHLIGVLRGFFYKLIYFRNIKSSIFSLQANSRIEIFNKSSIINIGKFAFIRKNASIRIDFNGELNIGENVFINDNCNINCVKRISIGKNTKIAPNVCINDHDHNYKKSGGDHLLRGEVSIGDNVWIGSNVVILRDTHIGDNVVIGAGSVVKGTVSANTLFFNKRENGSFSLNRTNKVVKINNLENMKA